MSRRTVALWIAAAAVLLTLVVAALAGRGSSPARSEIAAYIEAVNRVERQMAPSLSRTAKAQRELATKGSIGAKARAGLLDSERTLRTLRRRVAALPAPERAARLRALLLELLDAEAATAREVAALARFAPSYQAVLRELQAARTRLSRALAAVRAPEPRTLRGTRAQVAAAQAAFEAESARAAAAQADAIGAYLGALAPLEARLRALVPPAVMRPAWLAEIRMLAGTRAAGKALAEELRKPARPRVSVLARDFAAASRTAGSVRAQRAQAAAIQAYNRRVRRIGALQSRLRDELARLQRGS